MSTPDLTTKSVENIKTEIATLNEELDRRKKKYIADGEIFGLQCVDPNGTQKKKRRNSKQHHDQA